MTISIIIRLAVYFIAGIIQDFLLTMNWRYVAKEKTLRAVVFSFSTTIVGMVVFYNIITALDPNKSLLAILIYALGIATGTFAAMKFKIGTDD